MPLLTTGIGIYASTGGGGSPTFTPGVSVVPKANGFSAGTITFSNLNNGVNYPAGAVVVLGIFIDQVMTLPASPLLGGVTPTVVTGSQNTSQQTFLYQATMVSSSPDTFTFTNGAAMNRVGVAAGYFTNLVSSTATTAGNELFANQPDPQFLSSAITVPSGGFGVAFVGCIGATPPTAMTWTNTTSSSGDIFASLAGQMAVGLSHTATAGSWMGGAGTGGVSGVTNAMGFISSMAGACYN